MHTKIVTSTTARRAGFPQGPVRIPPAMLAAGCATPFVLGPAGAAAPGRPALPDPPAWQDEDAYADWLAAVDALIALTPHRYCGGWSYDPRRPVIECACDADSHAVLIPAQRSSSASRCSGDTVLRITVIHFGPVALEKHDTSSA